MFCQITWREEIFVLLNIWGIIRILSGPRRFLFKDISLNNPHILLWEWAKQKWFLLEFLSYILHYKELHCTMPLCPPSRLLRSPGTSGDFGLLSWFARCSSHLPLCQLGVGSSRVHFSLSTWNFNVLMYVNLSGFPFKDDEVLLFK